MNETDMWSRGASKIPEKQQVPAETAPPVQDPQHSEGKDEEPPEKPFIVRAQVKFVLLVASIVVEAAVVWLWSRSVAQTHGLEGTAKVASVTILPIIAVMWVIGLAQRGFMRAGALGRTARTKVISLSFALLLVLPGLWQKVGYKETCWHTFVGGVIGLVG